LEEFVLEGKKIQEEHDKEGKTKNSFDDQQLSDLKLESTKPKEQAFVTPADTSFEVNVSINKNMTETGNIGDMKINVLNK
jgi:hypothetical protein